MIDRSLDRLRELDELFGASLNTLYSTVDAIEQHVIDADLVIGAVLVPGAAAPKLVTRTMLEADAAGLGAGRHRHRPGRLLRDQPCDDPRRSDLCGRRRRRTTASPTCRARCARTSTFALNNATLPFAVALANKGAEGACADDPHLLQRPQHP